MPAERFSDQRNRVIIVTAAETEQPRYTDGDCFRSHSVAVTRRIPARRRQTHRSAPLLTPVAVSTDSRLPDIVALAKPADGAGVSDTAFSPSSLPRPHVSIYCR